MTERLYRARADDLLRYLRRRFLNEADARDIAQETFLRFWRLQDSERLRSPEAYLFRIAGNLIYERRLREVGECQGQPVGDPPVDEHTPFELAAAAEEEALLRDTIRALPALWRSVLTLHLRDGLTFSQIAAQTGINLSLAKKYYYKAVTDCRERLAGLSIDPGQR